MHVLACTEFSCKILMINQSDQHYVVMRTDEALLPTVCMIGTSKY